MHFISSNNIAPVNESLVKEEVGQPFIQTADSQWLQANVRLINSNNDSASELKV
jgi:hypothetical protein